MFLSVYLGQEWMIIHQTGLFLTLHKGYAFNGNQSKLEQGKILIWF